MSELNEAQLTQLYEDWTALGAKREQERIIELLESVYDYPRGWDYDNPIASVIALIKGENKLEHPQALPLPPKTQKNTQPNWTGF